MSAESPLPDITSTLTAPGGEFRVDAHANESFPTASFTNEEAQLFQRQLEDLVLEFPSSVLTELIQERSEAIAKVAAFAKHDLDDKVFGGINAGDNQIGFSMLRPGHIFQDANGTLRNDWYFEPGVTAGTWTDNQTGGKWVDWIGDGAANDYTFGEDQVSIVLGFADQDVSTEVSGINVDNFGRNMDMLPHDINDARLMDNETEQMAVSLPTLIGQENDSVHIRLRYDRQVETQPRLYGLTFGLGSFLNSEDF